MTPLLRMNLDLRPQLRRNANKKSKPMSRFTWNVIAFSSLPSGNGGCFTFQMLSVCISKLYPCVEYDCTVICGGCCV